MRNVELIVKEGWEAYVDIKVAAYEKRLAEEEAVTVANGEPWSMPQAVRDAEAAAARDRADTEEAALNVARLTRRSE